MCGCFAMPIREADKVFIVTSGENMAVYAAANIASAVKSLARDMPAWAALSHRAM